VPATVCRSPRKPRELDCEGTCMLVMPVHDVLQTIHNRNDNKFFSCVFAIIVGNYELQNWWTAMVSWAVTLVSLMSTNSWLYTKFFLLVLGHHGSYLQKLCVHAQVLC
jgi:hypothetical protein